LQQARQVLAYSRGMAGKIRRDRRNASARSVGIVVGRDAEVTARFLPDIVWLRWMNAGVIGTAIGQDVVIMAGVGDLGGVRIPRRDEAVDIRRRGVVEDLLMRAGRAHRSAGGGVVDDIGNVPVRLSKVGIFQVDDEDVADLIGARLGGTGEDDAHGEREEVNAIGRFHGFVSGWTANKTCQIATDLRDDANVIFQRRMRSQRDECAEPATTKSQMGAYCELVVICRKHAVCATTVL